MPEQKVLHIFESEDGSEAISTSHTWEIVKTYLDFEGDVLVFTNVLKRVS